jgi:hypothetical protein
MDAFATSISLLLPCLLACRLLLAAVVGVAPNARLGDVANVMALLLIAGGQQVGVLVSTLSSTALQQECHTSH